MEYIVVKSTDYTEGTLISVHGTKYQAAKQVQILTRQNDCDATYDWEECEYN